MWIDTISVSAFDMKSQTSVNSSKSEGDANKILKLNTLLIYMKILLSADWRVALALALAQTECEGGLNLTNFN